MRSIQLVATGILEEREMPQPADPEHGEVTVRIRAVGVCGSDLHWYQDGRMGEFPAAFPQVLGHEPAGEILAVGKGVEKFSAGDRVVMEPSLTCGHCEFCIKGYHNHCVKTIFMGGPQAPGMFREYITLPAANCTHFSNDLSYATATLAEPLAVMMHMLELIEIRVGDTVAVTGAGPVGMLCAAMARAAGASRVFIADRLAYRLRLAMAMGADVAIHTTSQPVVETVLDATGGRGVDLVMEASGCAELMNAAIRMARMGGTVMQIGIFSELMPKIDIHTAMLKELDLKTLKRSNHRAIEALKLLGTGKIPTSLITHSLTLGETPRAFEMLTNYTDGVGKAIIEV
ncbi:MAG TPA: alcohol dehydrogenase catalytic domain-containing protein [Bryobacteraceae bacterium]|nr:alcohol dehydrogenase catalytic domain-containing protein [Bryobacteraceae bacterium]